MGKRNNKTSRIEGTVKSEQKCPIKDAAVSLANTSHHTTTNSDGKYHMKFIYPGNYRLEVEAKGFQKESITIELTKELTHNEDIILKTNSWYVKVYNSRPKRVVIIIGSIIIFVLTVLVSYFQLKRDTKTQYEELEDEFNSGDLNPQPLKFDTLNSEYKSAVTNKTTFLSPVSVSNKTSVDGHELTEDPDFSVPANYSFPKVTGIVWRRNTLPDIGINLGGKLTIPPLTSLKKGVELILSSGCNNESAKIPFILKDNRIYLSDEFRDLTKQEIIGFISYNHWKIFKKNRLSFYNDDDRLEVKDLQGNIAFSVKFEYVVDALDSIVINGYFINTASVTVLSTKDKNNRDVDACFLRNDPDWEINAGKIIEDISTIFPENL